MIDTYREYLAGVRGIAGGTIVRHAELARDFLRFLRYNDADHQQVRPSDVETFVVQESTRVGRITGQKVIAMCARFCDSSRLPEGSGRSRPSPRLAPTSSRRRIGPGAAMAGRIVIVAWN